jgi:hypothetical protein
MDVMNVDIKVIAHGHQRYETCGDYFEANIIGRPTLCIRVSDLGDWRMNALVMVHEFIEYCLIKHDRVPEPAVLAFDEAFEKARLENQKIVSTTTDDGHLEFEFRGRWYPLEYEPGDSPDAPYHRQHCFATAVERMLAAALGVRWWEYEQAVLALPAWKAGA